VTRVALRLFLALALVSLAGCPADDDGEPPVGRGPFLEPPPSAAEAAAQVAALEAEMAGRVPAATRTAVEAYVAAPAAYTPPAGTLDRDPAAGDGYWHATGARAFLQGSADTALWCFARGLQAKPDDGFLLAQAGFVLGYQGRAADAKPLLLRAASVAPGDAVVLEALGDAYAAASDWPRASYWLAQALALRPEEPGLHLKMARVMVARGQPRAARALLDTAARRAPEDAEIAAERDALPPLDQLPAGGALRVDSTARALDDQGNPETLREDVALGVEEVGALHEAHLREVEQAYQSDAAIRQDEHGANLSAAAACVGTCDGDEGCMEGCHGSFCAAEAGSHAAFAARIPKYATLYEGLAVAYAAGIEAATWDAVARWYGKVPDDDLFEEIEDMERAVASEHATAQMYYKMVEMAIAADGLQFEAPCTPPVDDLGALWSQSPGDDPQFDVCLDGLFCIGVDNDNLSFDFGVGPLQAEFGIDLGTGHFQVGIGVGARSPTGLLSGSVKIKLSSEKGVGVGGDVKVGNLVGGKISHDLWLGN
jgi:hypothetical protein